jgi:hypothetical protein
MTEAIGGENTMLQALLLMKLEWNSTNLHLSTLIVQKFLHDIKHVYQ